MDYPLSGLLVISWSVVSSIHFFLAIGIDALSQIRWMNHQRPFQSQSFDKTGEHNSPKLYPFVPERAKVSRQKTQDQDQDHIRITLLFFGVSISLLLLCAYIGHVSGWWWAKRFVESFILCTYAEFYDKTQQVRITRNTETYTSGNVVTHCPLH